MRLPIGFALFLAACEPTPEVIVGQQTLNLKAAGLWLTSNPLDAPPGALANAQNAVIRRPNVVEPRRGQKPDVTLNAPADAMGTFEGSVVVHNTDNEVEYRIDENSTAQIGTGGYESPTGAPTRFVEAGGALYWTTSEGLVRADSLTSSAVAAGMPPGLEGSGATTGSSGWLPTGSTVGYRFVWGSRDGDGALLIGAPSGRILVSNTSGGNRDVALTTPIPDGITVDTGFLQVYRTVITATSPADPGEDMAQVGEFFPSAAQIAAGTMTVTDIASFANGPSAYFNPTNGGGLADAREQPPLLTDALAFKGYLFGVVQAYRQTLEISLLGIGGSTGLAVGQGLIFEEAGTLVFSVAANASEDFTLGNFQLFTGGTAAQNIENTARSLVRVLNNYADSVVYASYASGPSDLPGKILMWSRTLDEPVITVRAFSNPVAWTPAMGSRLFGTTISRAGTTVTVTFTPTTAVNAFVVGQVVEMTTVDPLPADPDFPLGNKTIVSINTGAGQITYTEAGAAVTGTKDVYVFETLADTNLDFNQEATPASWAHSSFEEPDGFPPRFHYQVGGPSTRLDRITSQGEALLFWTSDGLYRLTGDDEASFTLRPMDPTVKLVGTKTPINMGNKVYAFTDQGLVSVSELGVEKISTPLDVALLPYYASTEDALEATRAAAFGVAYESENEYILFLPAPDAAPGDPADRAYTYNAQTRTWVGPWLFEWAGISTGAVETAIVGTDNRLYVAAGDRLTRERKDRALSDQQDADGVGIPYDVAYLVQTGGNPGAYKQWVECTEMLEAPQPSAVELYFATEIDTTEEGGTIPSQGNSNVRTYIPLNKSRSARLTVGLRHEAPLEKPVILGLSVVYNVNGTRVGR